jgi:hypothetical protein
LQVAQAAGYTVTLNVYALNMRGCPDHPTASRNIEHAESDAGNYALTDLPAGEPAPPRIKKQLMNTTSVLLGIALAVVAANGQTAARTADGQPDLQGIWSNATITPLERPADLAGKQTLTPEEAAAYEKKVLDRTNADHRGANGEADVATAYNQFWYDRGTKAVGTRRTSLIVDPSDGHIPALTPEAQKRVDEKRAWMDAHATDGPEGRSLGERCILWVTAGPPMLPGPYNNNFQILQTRDRVVILNEMIHDARVIPVDGSPHLPSNIRQWMGDSRGHWEHDTLVVDTTNYSDQYSFRGSDRNLHLTERFTRVSPEALLYEFTVDDPTAFTKPWTAQILVTRTKGPLFEYACHEGNYAMMDILAGARAEDKKVPK